MPKNKTPKLTSADCLKCGACCAPLYQQKVFCDVEPSDVKRMGTARFKRLAEEITPIARLTYEIAGLPSHLSGALKTKLISHSKGPLKDYTLCVCAALKGNLMHKVKCSIYEVRPNVCREACTPGSKGCLYARRRIRTFEEDI